MTAQDAARATAQAIGDLGGAFMLDGATYARGGELGFSGVDLYVTGRGGVLGDTAADVVAAAFVFWSPEQVRGLWESGRKVMAPAAAAGEWAAIAHAYAEANLPDVDGLDRLGDLLATVADAASPASGPTFAGWRATLEVPGPERPKARVQHLLTGIRELRGSLHGGAVLSAGLSPAEAVAFRAPHMAGIFGWDPESLPDGETVKDRWKVAEAGTDAAMGRVLGVLDDDLDELVSRLTELHDAWRQAMATKSEKG
jgi:hypothetical protein